MGAVQFGGCGSLLQEVHNWVDFCTTGGAAQQGSPVDNVFLLDFIYRIRKVFGVVILAQLKVPS